MLYTVWVMGREACSHHCRRCGSHFTSLKAFDAHDPLGGCTFPDLPDGGEWVELSDKTCYISGEEAIRGVTLFEHPDAARARATFRRKEDE